MVVQSWDKVLVASEINTTNGKGEWTYPQDLGWRPGLSLSGYVVMEKSVCFLELCFLSGK